MTQPVRYAIGIFFLLTGFHSFGQVTPQTSSSPDTVREFTIIRAPSMRAIKIDSATTLQTVAGGGVIIRQGGTLFHCDSAVVNNVTHVLEAFGNIEINQGDTVHTFGQYLKYLGVEKTAHIEKKVKLTNNKGTLFTETLDYNLQTGIGNFSNGGKVIDGNNVITSLEGTYYDDTRDIYFKKNVKLDGPKNHVRADSLVYNMQTRKSTFISQTQIKNDEVDIRTTEGSYDLNSGDALFTSRTTVKDSSGRLYSANSMALENKTGNAQLEGNAVIIDSAGGYIIIANQIFLNKKKNSFLATRKPVLIIRRKTDSTYVGADTIFSGFTTFVGNQNKVLQKDSMVNVNLAENEKVRQVITRDSALKIPPVPPGDAADSAAMRVPGKDALTRNIKPGKRIPGLSQGTRPPPADSTEPGKISGVTPADSLPPGNLQHQPERVPVNAADSVQTKMPSAVAADTLQQQALTGHRRGDTSAVTRSLPADSLPAAGRRDSTHADSPGTSGVQPLPDSLAAAGKIKDSTATADTAIRYFIAFHHVKIYNDSLQSICDSLFISSRDSVFRLYYAPVVWSGNTQIAGDTMFLYTENKQAKRLYVFERGLIVNRTREGFFNQMAGKTINGYFAGGHIDYMRVRGAQSESIFYMQDDDSAYIGMNRASGDVIDLYFKNENLNRVLFINEIKGQMYPMNQVPADQARLKNFEWLENKRPMNKAAVFE